ncbi:MAG: hypothetical protein H7Y17_02155 [Chlorobia bacterium]|nr:hypothetical protein [Fimbriimonadaceae bacterium]
MRQAFWMVAFGLSGFTVFASALIILAFLPGFPSPYTLVYTVTAAVAMSIGVLGVTLSNRALKKADNETMQPRLPL